MVVSKVIVPITEIKKTNRATNPERELGSGNNIVNSVRRTSTPQIPTKSSALEKRLLCALKMAANNQIISKLIKLVTAKKPVTAIEIVKLPVFICQ